MYKIYKYAVLSLLFVSSVIFAQKYTISGKVTDDANGEKLVGANVFIKGTTIGAATKADGMYKITVDKGQYTVVCSYIGFEKQEVNVNVTNNVELNFAMKEHEFSLNVTVLADRAKERETPVAFTNVSKKQMEYQLGSRDIPLVLNTTPSVYATQQGGGAGDARINVRGFDQRNIAIMINGVPVNDMENGWVYWSNWDGVGDATSSIQVQRGMSAVNLAVASIGGTMNIITDPTAAKSGFRFKQEYGSGTFLKSTLSANTGLIDGKWALSGTVVRKFGDGLIDKTWTDAWAYYVGASYNINKSNRLEFYAVGAPQKHGQNLYKQNIAAYSHSLATELGYSKAALDKFKEKGRFYNENWNNVDPGYRGLQAWNSNMLTGASTGTHPRYDAGFINERENFFHKPQVNLNWYSQMSDQFSLYTTAYYSGGTGGGSGTLGHLTWDYSGPSRIADWNATIAANRANADADGNHVSSGILRNSRNDQWTLGAISKAYYKVSDNLKTSVGIDWRTASIDHYREVRDLLGGDYYVSTASQFWTTADQQRRHLGQKLNYFNTNTVDWLGGYAQAEYTMDQFTMYGTAGWSQIKYSFTDHFKTAKKLADGSPDLNSGELYTESDNISGYQFKGGLSYRITPTVDAFVNAGYISKVPIFDNVINDRDGSKAANPKNEKYTDVEAGVNLTALENTLSIKANVYYLKWTDRSKTTGVQNPDGSEGLVFLQGLAAQHMGFELEANYLPIRQLRLGFTGSIGDWKYTDDVSGRYATYTSGAPNYTPFNFYVKDLKVGNQPQTSLVFDVTVVPFKGLSFSGIVKHYMNNYADWDPFSRTDPNDRAQSWKTPDFTVVDFHFAYDLPFDLGGTRLQLFGHLFNALDEVYVQDATDNSRFNAFKDNGKTHSADDAEVFLGIPRTFNVGLSLAY